MKIKEFYFSQGMDIETVVKTVERLERDENRQKTIFALASEPLSAPHQFRVEPNGALSLYIGLGIQRVTKRTMTHEHIGVYVECLTKRLEQYEAIIKHNVRVCRTYVPPRLETDEVRAFVHEAFVESFWRKKVMESYVV